jgi:hypothetical protein
MGTAPSTIVTKKDRFTHVPLLGLVRVPSTYRPVADILAMPAWASSILCRQQNNLAAVKSFRQTKTHVRCNLDLLLPQRRSILADHRGKIGEQRQPQKRLPFLLGECRLLKERALGLSFPHSPRASLLGGRVRSPSNRGAFTLVFGACGSRRYRVRRLGNRVDVMFLHHPSFSKFPVV